MHLTAEDSLTGLQLGVAGRFVRLDALVVSDRGPRFGDLRVVAVPIKWHRLTYGALRNAYPLCETSLMPCSWTRYS